MDFKKLAEFATMTLDFNLRGDNHSFMALECNYRVPLLMYCYKRLLMAIRSYAITANCY